MLTTLQIITLLVSIVLVIFSLILLYCTCKMKVMENVNDEIIVPEDIEKHLILHFDFQPEQVN